MLTPHFYRLSSLFCAISLSLSATQAHASEGFVAATLAENLNTTQVKEAENKNRTEGWVLMSYVIKTDGQPQGVEVVELSTKGNYAAQSINYVKQLRFKPATFNGIPIESTTTFFLRHDMSFYGNNNDGISTGFRNRYNDADQLVRSKQFDKAKEALDTLDYANTKNLSEQALTAWLHSIYYARQGNWPAYGKHLLSAVRLRDELPTKMAVKSTQNLFDYLKFKKQFADAIEVLISMLSIENADLDDATFAVMLAPLLEVIEGDSVIQVKTTLKENQAWLHLIPRDTITLTYTDGQIDKAELRCDNAWQTLDAKSINELKIPQQYIGCRILLSGTPGTKVSLTEQGKTRNFNGVLDL
jgi:hypothetical protein